MAADNGNLEFEWSRSPESLALGDEPASRTDRQAQRHGRNRYTLYKVSGLERRRNLEPVAALRPVQATHLQPSRANEFTGRLEPRQDAHVVLGGRSPKDDAEFGHCWLLPGGADRDCAKVMGPKGSGRAGRSRRARRPPPRGDSVPKRRHPLSLARGVPSLSAQCPPAGPDDSS